MKILLTNDDGINAPGIVAMEKELARRGHELIIIAPLTQQSAASHSISLFKPMKISNHGEKRYAIDGTPTDCMILGSQLLVDDSIDLVISGINAGQNMGEDVLYSGTVAAALEAMFLGFKAIAISIAAYENQKFDTAAKWLADLLDDNLIELIDGNEALNINVPNIDYEEVRGVRSTRIGHRKYFNFINKQINENGETEYLIGGDTPKWEELENSDANAVFNNYISITPISPDFTKTKSLKKINKWINKK